MMPPVPDRLPDGNYPFIDSEYPLADMTMAEAPPELEQLIRQQAEATGLEIIRDVPVESLQAKEQKNEHISPALGAARTAAIRRQNDTLRTTFLSGKTAFTGWAP